MDAAAHSDEEYEDDLELLQKELDALKNVLGRGYQQIEVPVYDEEAPEEGLAYEQSREQDDDVETDYAEGGTSFVTEAPSAPQQQQHQQAEVSVPSSGSAEVQALRAALEANRALQARLQRLLRSTNRAIDRNADLVARVRTLDTKKETAAVGLPGARAQAAAAASAAGIPLPSTTSMFWQVDGLPPPPHPEWAELAPVAAHLPHTFRRQPWTEDERAKLKEGVLQMVQEERVNAALGELYARVEAGGGVTLQDYEDVSRAVGTLTLEAPEVQVTADQLTLAQWGVVLQRQQLGSQRSPLEAQLHWRNALRPALARGGFTPEEDGKLRAAVERLGERAWAAVARELGGSRTPVACLARFRALQAQRAAEEREGRGERLGELSAQELARLGELVKQHNGQWKVIGPAFGGGWSGDQLYHMWRRHEQRGGVGTLQEHRKGRWTKEEDQLLLKAMAVHQRKWFKVAAMVPGRSDVQCRERFMNVLNPEVRQHEAWTPQEDERLRELVPQFTKEGTGRIKWSAVAAQIEGRTDKQCAIRYKAIKSGALGGLRSKKTPSGKSRSGSKSGASDASEPSQPRQPRRQAGAGKRRRQRHSGEGGEGEGEGEQMPGGIESGGSSEEGAEGTEDEEQGGGELQGALGSAELAQRPQRARRRSVRVTWDLPSSSSGSGGEGEGGLKAEAGEGELEQEQEEEQRPARGRDGKKDGGSKRARSASTSLGRQGESASAGAGSSGRVASQPQGLGVQPKAGKRPAEGLAKTDAGEAEGQQEALGAAGAAACQPQQPTQQQPKRQKRATKQQQQQPVKRVKPSTRMAAAPPAPTVAVMPCTRTAAVGREVWVWWIVEEDTGRGRLYPGTIDSYDHTTGMHTVEYGEERPEQHALAEENVAWGTGEVTGPGAVWPEDVSAPQAVQAAAQQPAQAPDSQPDSLEERQEQQQQQQEQEQGGSAPGTVGPQLLSSGQPLPHPQAVDSPTGSQGQQQQQQQQVQEQEQHRQPQE